MWSRLSCSFLLWILLASMTYSQVTVGRISGTVTDQSGAAVGGAVVSAIELHSGAKVRATTLDVGRCVLPIVVEIFQAARASVMTSRSVSLADNLAASE